MCQYGAEAQKKLLTTRRNYAILLYTGVGVIVGPILRGVAQMVARLVRDQEVVGSNPVTPTSVTLDPYIRVQRHFFTYGKTGLRHLFYYIVTA